MEDQTNANTEELDTQSSEQPAITSPDVETDENAKKSARTLKLKAAEAGDSASSQEPVAAASAEADTPTKASANGDDEGQQGR